ncbi:hypothetical protein LINPERHAP1_LOCUS20308, partial [Linum perenne]
PPFDYPLSSPYLPLSSPPLPYFSFFPSPHLRPSSLLPFTSDPPPSDCSSSSLPPSIVLSPPPTFYHPPFPSSSSPSLLLFLIETKSIEMFRSTTKNTKMKKWRNV